MHGDSPDPPARLTYSLPLDTVGAFPALFAALDARGDALGVGGLGVTLTSLEDVFLKVTAARSRSRPSNGLERGPRRTQIGRCFCERS